MRYTYALYSGVVAQTDGDRSTAACVSGFGQGLPVPSVGDWIHAPDAKGEVTGRTFVYNERGLKTVVVDVRSDGR